MEEVAPPLSSKVASSAPELVLTQSNELLARARRVYGGQTSSMMKRPEQFAPGAYPVYLREGRGAVTVDVDGRAYVDFICALGASSLGQRHPVVEEAIAGALQRGVLHSLPIELEVLAAEAVLDATPGAERVRFFKTGADATSAAIRIARASTGRDRIVVVGYNGWHDHFMFDTSGVPTAIARLTERFDLKREEQEAALIDRLTRGDEDLAAVILSVPYNRVLSREYLAQLRQACSNAGTLLVLDEIVTGYRVGPGGIQQLLGVKADLVCLSKALAAGMPLSAVAGPERYLAVVDQLQVSTTFDAEALSLAACLAAHSVYAQGWYYERIAHLGRRLAQGINRESEALATPLRVVGYDPIPMFLFSGALPEHVRLATCFVGLMARRGFLLRRDVNFLCAAHTDGQVDAAIGAAAESLGEMKQAGCFAG